MGGQRGRVAGARWRRAGVCWGIAWGLWGQALAQGAPAPGAAASPHAQIAGWVADRDLGDGGLVALTRHSDAAVRRAALRGLGQLQVPEAQAPLIAAVADPDPAVRAEAAFGLGQLPATSETRAALVARLAAEPVAAVTDRLVEALGKVGTAADEPALLALAAGPTPAPLRGAARTALGLMARRHDGATTVRAEQLVAWLAEPDVEGRLGAAYLLQRATSHASPAVLAAARRCAQDPQAAVRVRCVTALARFEPAPTDALAQAADDPDWRVQVAAVRGLGPKGPALAQWLTAQAARLTPGTSTWQGAAMHPVLEGLDQALARPGPVSPALRAAGAALATAAAASSTASGAMGARQVACRVAALRAQGRTGGDWAACAGLPPVLVEALRVGAVAALPTGLARDQALAAAYGALGPVGQGAALAALADGGPAALGGAPARRALRVALWRRALASKDPAVVAAAAEGAATLALTELADPLLAAYAALAEQDALEALQAVFAAFGALRLTAALPILQTHATSGHPALRAAAAAALAAQGVPIEPAPRLPPDSDVAEGAPSQEATRDGPWRAAVLHTTKGQVALRLWPEDAPLTVAQFARLAQRGFFDGLLFHRVVPGFVAQGGDPRGDGWGGPGGTLPCEINPHRYGRGAVGMALAGKDTGGSQFFITHAAHPHLDGRYTVFGQVVGGQAVADALMVGDRITRVELSASPPSR